MTTIKEVAKQSGFSQATISRLFKGDETLSITEETKNIIINTALAMGFDRSKIKTTLEKIVFLFWITKQEEV
ncbi:MAG: LacI family DNA-binding transcriptional regulator, partial [Lactococcus raffinolactis]|nr:LacI family DNA-binding transcriptional regulator [Lactococcus raffinolactis]